MIKRILLALLTVFTLVSFLTVSSYAAENKIRMVETNLPDVIVEYRDSISESDIQSVKLGDETLPVSSVQKGKDAKTLSYILIDTSTSMRQAHLDSLKPSLVNYIKKAKGTAVLLTFGNGVQTLLKGNEKDDVIEKTIKDIKCNSNNTNFYDALNKVFDRAEKETGYDRKLVIVISDGADYEAGNSSQEEVIDRYKSHALPIYALCQDKTQKSSADGFGYIARSSGGDLVTFNPSNGANQFQSVNNKTDNTTLITLKSTKKKSAGSEQLQVNIDSERFSLDIPVKAKPDTKSPKVKSIEYDKGSKLFIPVEQLDMIGKFSGKDGAKPKLNKK